MKYLSFSASVCFGTALLALTAFISNANAQTTNAYAGVKGFRLHMRMTWRNIEKDSMEWHWQRSQDKGNTWEDSWVIHYVRQ